MNCEIKHKQSQKAKLLEDACIIYQPEVERICNCCGAKIIGLCDCQFINED